ncbi:MAG: MFS transporter [Spirochaetota bacterium]
MKGEKTAVLLTILLASFLSAFMGSSLNVALPAISREFSMDVVMTGWIATSFLLASAVFALPAGRVSDIKGRRRVFICGIIINLVSSIAAVFSVNQWMLIVLRAMQGSGAAMMFSTSNPILISSFPPQKRGKVLGMGVGAVYAGLSAGPFLGGVFTHYAGWRSVFIFNAAMLLLVLVLTFVSIRRDEPLSHGEPFDAAGSFVNALFLGFLIFAMTSVPSRAAYALFASAAFFAFLFVYMQIREKHPILKLSLFRGNPVFLKSNIAAMINYSATFAIAFLLSLYLQYVRGYSPQGAGMILLWQPVVQAVLSPAMGRLSDRVEPRILSSCGMALIAAALACFIFISSVMPMYVIIGLLIFMGAGFALFSSPNTNAVMGAVTRRDLGMASAVLSTMRIFGQIMSMAIAMLIFSLVIGRVSIDPSNIGSFLFSVRICFAVFAALCAMGIWFSLSRGTMHDKRGNISGGTSV